MDKKMIRLGSVVTDRPTQRRGTVTHMRIGANHEIWYRFQPMGVSKKSGGPFGGVWREKVLLQVDDADMVDMPDDMPLNVLATMVTDKLTGREGMVVALVLHVTGCFHVEFQPQTVKETGESAVQEDINIQFIHSDALATAKAAGHKRRDSPGETDGGPMLRQHGPSESCSAPFC